MSCKETGKSPLGRLPSPPNPITVSPKNEYSGQGATEEMASVEPLPSSVEAMEDTTCESFSCKQVPRSASILVDNSQGFKRDDNIKSWYPKSASAAISGESVRPLLSAAGLSAITLSNKRTVTENIYQRQRSRQTSTLHKKSSLKTLQKHKHGEWPVDLDRKVEKDVVHAGRTKGLQRMARSAPSSPRGFESVGLLSVSDCIKVVGRVRPLNEDELLRGDEECLSVNHNPNQDIIRVVHETNLKSPSKRFADIAQLPSFTERLFSFHACIGPQDDQKCVFQKSDIGGLLDQALHGTNVTIFAVSRHGQSYILPQNP